MSIHVALFHRTRYSYDRAVSHAPHVVRLRPAPHCRTQILSYSLKIGGGQFFLNWQQDPFSNWNGRLVLPEPMREFVVEVELVAEMAVHNPFDFFLEEAATAVPFEYEAGLRKELAPFLECSETGPLLGAYVAAVRRDLEESAAAGRKLRTVDFLVSLNQRIQQDVHYVIRLEPGVQPPEVTLSRASGSCRDSAWLMCQTLRRLGFAARFASGYLIQLAPDVKALDGPSGTETDFTDLHAWCEVYLPGAGWIGFDPTSGLLAGEGHIPLSCTPEPASAAPVTGAVDPCESELEHEMRLTRIYESPRVTKPYSEEQWAAVLKLGEQIDQELQQADVRLTMGGEPTFVSIDHPDAPEWNFDAVSTSKRVLSGTLIRRLRERFAPGAVLHYGQGKWYPGEPLPRYALTALWRRDGVPLWHDPALIADESVDYEHGLLEARSLIERIASLLALDSSCIVPGYEDALYYVWRERCLPADVTVADSKLGTAQERERFRRIFAQGLHSEVGYALPLQRGFHGDWESSRWKLRDDNRLWLIPGDSPMGLRLPLDSLLWQTSPRHPQFYPVDPTQPLPPPPA